jgi:hypothetical protein
VTKREAHKEGKLRSEPKMECHCSTLVRRKEGASKQRHPDRNEERAKEPFRRVTTNVPSKSAWPQTISVKPTPNRIYNEQSPMLFTSGCRSSSKRRMRRRDKLVLNILALTLSVKAIKQHQLCSRADFSS